MFVEDSSVSEEFLMDSDILFSLRVYGKDAM